MTTTISIGFRADLAWPMNGYSKTEATQMMTNGMRWALSRGPVCYAKEANAL